MTFFLSVTRIDGYLRSRCTTMFVSDLQQKLPHIAAIIKSWFNPGFLTKRPANHVVLKPIYRLLRQIYLPILGHGNAAKFQSPMPKVAVKVSWQKLILIGRFKYYRGCQLLNWFQFPPLWLTYSKVSLGSTIWTCVHNGKQYGIARVFFSLRIKLTCLPGIDLIF